MANTKHDFGEYMDNSKKLFKALFGKELYKKLKSIPLKSIDWKGLDVTTGQIRATCPGITERFNEKWMEYWSDKDYTLLDLYLQSVFHYGYQQSYEVNKETIDMLQSLCDTYTKFLKTDIDTPFVKKTTFTIDCNDFDVFVGSKYGGNFEFVAEQEANNNSSYQFSAPNKVMFFGNEKEEIRKGKYNHSSIHQLFQVLYEDGHLEAGDYTINVSW